MSENSAKGAFGLILALLAPFVAFSSYHHKEKEESFDDCDSRKGTLKSKELFSMTRLLHDIQARDKFEIVRMTCVGFGVGVLSAAMGIGATPVMITYLTLSGDSKSEDYKTILGTSLCSVCLTTCAGFAAHSTMGCVQWKMLPPLLLGSALGGAIGSHLALDLPNTTLQYVFAIFCGAYGLRVVQRTWLRKLV